MKNKNTNRISHFIKKNRYYNDSQDTLESFIFHTLPAFLTSLRGRKKRLPLNKDEWHTFQKPLERSVKPVITWIGHSTFLIQVENVNILTDPIFGNASFLFSRLFAPGIPLEQLPAIDMVLISHNHRDHCEVASLKALQKANPTLQIFIPHGDFGWLSRKGLTGLREHEWWQESTYERDAKPVICTFLPAWHWSGNGLFDWNKALWGSWLIQGNGVSLYFAGDTAYSGHFKAIAQEFPNINVALLPIGPGTPHPHMRKSHLDAAQAVQAFKDLGAQHFIPMHWGTFQFGLDTFYGPIESFLQSWQESPDLIQKPYSILKIGQRLTLL